MDGYCVKLHRITGVKIMQNEKAAEKDGSRRGEEKRERLVNLQLVQRPYSALESKAWFGLDLMEQNRGVAFADALLLVQSAVVSNCGPQ